MFPEVTVNVRAQSMSLDKTMQSRQPFVAYSVSNDYAL